MRKKIVAGNWKMNKTISEGLALLSDLRERVVSSTCDVVVAVPYILLGEASHLLKGSVIKVAAENCADHASGAYTGEISAEMVVSTGATHCIIGHSERRMYYNETFTVLKDKVDLALQNGLRPIFCVGECKSERDKGCQLEIVKAQMEGSLFHLSKEDFSKIIIAYEPVWAIGTGVTATPDEAEQMHVYIRDVIAKKYGLDIAENTTILYGGSCNEKNANDLFQKKNVDGGLIGGASLIADKFVSIINTMNALL